MASLETEAQHVNKSLFCFEQSGVTSSGLFAGDDPLKYFFPLLLCQVCIVFTLSRAVHAVLRRLNQPLAISQIIAGALLGPSFLGRNQRVAQLFTAPEAWLQLNTVGNYALTLFYFTVSVKTDLGMIPKSGRKAFAIALLGDVLPRVAMYAAYAALRQRIPAAWTSSFILTVVWRWSNSSFIVISCVLEDLNLLSSKLGRLAMSASVISGLVNMFLLTGVFYYNIITSSSGKLQRVGIGSLFSFIAFVVLIVLIARPVVLRLIRDVPEGALLDEQRIVGVVLVALTSSLVGELVGLHALFGAFLLGLILPSGTPLGVTMTERLDPMVTGVLLPLYLAQGGMRMDLGQLSADASELAVLETILIVGAVAKFVGSMLPCLFFGMPVREAVVVGLTLNLKGITEVAYLAKWIENKTIHGQFYTAFMLTMLVLSSTTAPMVKFLYRLEDEFVAYRRRTVEHAKPGEELRVVACIHAQPDVGPVLALLDLESPSPVAPLTVHLLHLVPLAGLITPVLRPIKLGDKKSAARGSEDSDRIVKAFHHFVQQRPQGAVSVVPYVSISPYATMHGDVCTVAVEKRAVLIIIPFHKRLAIDGSVELTSSNAGGIQEAHLKILQYSPCSVAILIDRGGFSPAAADVGLPHRVALYFLGGPDDREALALVTRMAEDAFLELTVFRFIPAPEQHDSDDGEEDRLADEEALQAFVQRWADSRRCVYSEEAVSTSEQMVAVIRRTSMAFTLLIVGRRAESPDTPLTTGISDWCEHPELGVVGDLLSSSDFGCPVSTLVVQQQTTAAAGEGKRR